MDAESSSVDEARRFVRWGLCVGSIGCRILSCVDAMRCDRSLTFCFLVSLFLVSSLPLFQKEGRAQNMRPQPGDDDALHVLIAGDDEERVIATTKEVEKLLVPIDETKNEHKGTDNKHAWA